MVEGVTALSQEDRALLTMVQAAIPLVPRPFCALGERLGLTEEEVMARLRALRQARLIRKLGPVFEPAALGLASELVAVQVAPDRLDAVGRFISAWSEVTHCYAREHPINLWFAGVAANADWFAQAAGEVAREAGVEGIWRLPTLRRFKIAVQFDLGTRGEDRLQSAPADLRPVPASKTPQPKPPLQGGDRLEPILPQFVHALEADLPIIPEPFASLAAQAGVCGDELLAALRQFVESGVIRRYGALVSHRLLGFTANAMTVWCAPEPRMEQAGGIIAASPHVSHCYSRPSFAGFPYNLYAMIHGKTRQHCLEVAQELTRAAGLEEPLMLFSTTEYKKSAPDYGRLLQQRLCALRASSAFSVSKRKDCN